MGWRGERAGSHNQGISLVHSVGTGLPEGKMEALFHSTDTRRNKHMSMLAVECLNF